MASTSSAGRRLASVGLFAAATLAGCAEQASIPAAADPRPPVEVRTAVDRAVATTGDLITYRVIVDYDPVYEVEVPEPGTEIAGFRIVDIGSEEPRSEGGRKVEERWYQLRADLVGSYILPAVEVVYRPAAAEPAADDPVVKTSEIFVEVESVLPDEGGAEDIRDIKALHEIRPSWPWKPILAGLALVAGIGLLLWWRRRKTVELPRTPAHEIAFRALDELRGADLSDFRAIRRFYFRLSETVRAYVEDRFALNATDLTTEEIFERLHEVEELPPDPKTTLERFLLATDEVKFAHRRPGESDIESVWESALGFVEATRPADPAEREEAA